MSTLMDLTKGIIEYEGKEIHIILDDKKKPWFNSTSLMKILGHSNPRKALRDHVPEKNKKQLSNLVKYVTDLPKNSQPHSYYVNESGLYGLIMFSKLKGAEEFRNWITDEVLPTIRETGMYISSNENTLLKKMDSKIKKLTKELRILKNNQKKTRGPQGGMVYILKPIKTTSKLLRIGSTEDIENRMNVHNSAVADNMELLFKFPTKNHKEVENCVKYALKKYQYRKNREYYKCQLDTIRKLIKKCENIEDLKSDCNNCNKNKKITKIVKHQFEEHGHSSSDDVFVMMIENQNGGSDQIEFSLNEKINDLMDESSDDLINELSNDLISELSNDSVNESSDDLINEESNDSINEQSNELFSESSSENLDEISEKLTNELNDDDDDDELKKLFNIIYEDLRQKMVGGTNKSNSNQRNANNSHYLMESKTKELIRDSYKVSYNILVSYLNGDMDMQIINWTLENK
jgi:prophage antirepressor-like protein/uncharacterized membrane protein YcaP (DUF421 family)